MILSFDTNFWGAIRVLQAALPLMPQTGMLSLQLDARMCLLQYKLTILVTLSNYPLAQCTILISEIGCVVKPQQCSTCSDRPAADIS